MNRIRAVGDIHVSNVEAQSHDGRELALMLAGRKPLAVFSDAILLDEEPAKSEFDDYVQDGRIVKRVQEHRWQKPQEQGGKLVVGTKRTLFALKAESWRIPAYLLLREASEDVPWNEGLEAVSCRLLGYTREETEVWLEHIKRTYGGWGAIPVFIALTRADVAKVEMLGYKALPPDFNGPDFLVVQERCPNFEKMCPDLRAEGLRPARLALSAKFTLGLSIQMRGEIRIAKFDPSFVRQINQNLRRDIEILNLTDT